MKSNLRLRILCHHALATLVSACFTPFGSAQDLNANSVEDARDLREGTSDDCNTNGFIDERDAGVPHFSQAIEHLNALEGEMFQNNVWDAKPIDFNADGLMDLVVTSMYRGQSRSGAMRVVPAWCTSPGI